MPAQRPNVRTEDLVVGDVVPCLRPGHVAPIVRIVEHDERRLRITQFTGDANLDRLFTKRTQHAHHGRVEYPSDARIVAAAVRASMRGHNVHVAARELGIPSIIAVDAVARWKAGES